MQHPILFTTCALALIATTAQANSDLFPELKKEPTPIVETPAQEKDVKLFKDDLGLNLDIEQQKKLIDGVTEEVVDLGIKVPTQSVPENPKLSEETEQKKQSGYIEIHPHDIKIIMPPVGPDSQFCKGSLTLENQTKYNLKSLDIRILLGNARYPYKFRSVPAGQSGTGSVVLAGTYCQDLTRAAPIEVESCQLEGETEQECKQMVKYLIK